MNTRKIFAVLSALVVGGLGIATVAGQSAEAALAMN
jgi:hypothetical protein